MSSESDRAKNADKKERSFQTEEQRQKNAERHRADENTDHKDRPAQYRDAPDAAGNNHAKRDG